MKKSLLDWTEKHLKDNYRGKEATFKNIWADVVDKHADTIADIESFISEYYSDLTQDHRFVNIGNNKWMLRENVKYEDYKKNKSSMFGLENLKEIEIKEAKSKEVEVLESDIVEELNESIGIKENEE